MEEESLYHHRLDEILEAEHVVMMVECLSDGKSNRLFRALEIKG